MIGIIAFGVSIIGVLMSFFANLKVVAFMVAIASIIIAVLSAYDKDEKELKKDAKKDSRALEVGSIILAGATCVTYFISLLIA